MQQVLINAGVREGSLAEWILMGLVRKTKTTQSPYTTLTPPVANDVITLQVMDDKQNQLLYDRTTGQYLRLSI